MLAEALGQGVPKFFHVVYHSRVRLPSRMTELSDSSASQG